MIIYDDHTIWRSSMMIMCEHHTCWSYMMIIYDDPRWSSEQDSESREAHTPNKTQHLRTRTQPHTMPSTCRNQTPNTTTHTDIYFLNNTHTHCSLPALGGHTITNARNSSPGIPINCFARIYSGKWLHINQKYNLYILQLCLVGFLEHDHYNDVYYGWCDVSMCMP